MKAEEKPKFVKESKELFESLNIEKLINNPNEFQEIKKINRLIAIFTNFDSNTGNQLDILFKDFQKWARASTRTGHIKNRATDMLQYIDKTIQAMDIYEIKQDKPEGAIVDSKVDVALSFAGEQRPFVEKVALYVEQQGNLSVFYDTNHEIEMWGNNLADYLKNIFEKANYCVMFISKEYAEKTWPNFERQIIQAKALIDDGYLLPARFDDTPLKGEIPTIKYISLKDLSPEEFGRMLIKKVVGGDKYESKKESAIVTVSNQSQISTSEEIPLLYIKPSVGGTGGANGHYLYFIVKNMTRQVLLDIKWGIRGFGYEWTPNKSFFELEPLQEQELTFPLSGEIPFTNEIPELNFFAEYKDLAGQKYFVRRELEQELVPSAGFYSFKAASFHSPTILKDDGLRFLSGPHHVGDRDEARFAISTQQGEKEIIIGISRTLRSVWGFSQENQLKQALLELGHRKIRRMLQENNLKDHIFTSYDYPGGEIRGIESYKRLRDSI